MFGGFADVPIQWAILATVLAGFATAFFKFRPDQTRAITEGRLAEAQVIAAAKVAAAAAIAEAKLAEDKDTTDRFREFRAEVHALKNEIMVLIAKQEKSDLKQAELEKMLNHALSHSSMRQGQISMLTSLVELLVSEIERLDPDSIIMKQAKMMLKQIKEASTPGDGWKSDALNNAETADHDAEQTRRSTKAAVDDVKASEAKNG